MSYEFTKLAEVEALTEVPENATVLAEVDGAVKRVPGSGLGGGGGNEKPDVSFTIMQASNGDNEYTAIVRLKVDYDTFMKKLQLDDGSGETTNYPRLNLEVGFVREGYDDGEDYNQGTAYTVRPLIVRSVYDDNGSFVLGRSISFMCMDEDLKVYHCVFNYDYDDEEGVLYTKNPRVEYVEQLQSALL